MLPRIYLTIDNCFASKRWTSPSRWAEIVHGLGLQYVEASADNECDPLYTTPAYRDSWRREVLSARDRLGVNVVNLYSGHGTYSTLGLAHDDAHIRSHIRDNWLEKMAVLAGQLDAGLGFFCHAFSQDILQDPMRNAKARTRLYKDLAHVAAVAQDSGCTSVGVEQMYTPHQIPWTLAGAQDMMTAVYAHAGHPLYITIDTGHACGQQRFLRPDDQALQEALADASRGKRLDDLWLGSGSADDLFQRAVGGSPSERDELLVQIEADMEAHPFLFASEGDGDPYQWLERFACYSPIIHLQQTDGRTSTHWPFTPDFNERGIILGDSLLEAVTQSYLAPTLDSMPPRCEKIYLTIEVFSGTMDKPREIIHRLEETVAYWRRFVPTDGLRLDQLPGRHACRAQVP